MAPSWLNSRRSLAPGWPIALVVALAACGGDRSPTLEPWGLEVPRAPSTVESVSGRVPLVAASSAAAEPESPPGEEPGSISRSSQPAVAQIGRYPDWIAAYQGIFPGPERNKPPPRLATIEALPALPSSVLLYRKSGHLMRMELPSGQRRALSQGPFWDSGPVVSRDGKWVFFVSTREHGTRAIFRMRPDGTEITQILAKMAGVEAWTISDDGSMLAYTVVTGETDRRLRLARLDTSSLVEDREIYQVDSWTLENLSMSRDGRRLFFVEGGFGNERMKSIDLETDAVTALPRGGYDEFGSIEDLGDGRLAFVASDTAGFCCRAGEIHTMPIAGGRWQIDPRFGRWSVESGSFGLTMAPDGQHFALEVEQRQGGFGADWFYEIYAPGRVTEPFPRPFYSASNPSFAPDSRHLAFVLSLCPYAGCEPHMDAIVVVDTEQPLADLQWAFVDYGEAPAFLPRML